MRFLFVTGKLAEPALRRALADLAPSVGFTADVAVLPISVAALMTTDWIARHLHVPPGTEKVLLPGLCQGDLGAVTRNVRRSGRAWTKRPSRPGGVFRS